MFRLGATSISRLKGVHPDLIRVVTLGIEYSFYDFTVTEGVRTIERQRELVSRGASMTMASRHLVQADGFGHAFDVVAVGDLNKDGSIDAQDKALVWKPELYRGISVAMLAAATELGVRIRWGGDFKAHNGKPFFDGPHFELVSRVGPSR